LGPFAHYPSKRKSVISYSVRWDNWVLLVTDRGKFLISPNDMQLIETTKQQIEKVKDSEMSEDESEIIAANPARWLSFFVIATVASVFLLLFMGYKQPRVVFDTGAFKLKGLYGVNIPFSEIAEADTIAWREMPRISRRTNGISLMKVNRGHFRTTDGDKIQLSVNCGISPVIRIVEKNGTVYYINRKNATETRKIFNEIQNGKESF